MSSQARNISVSISLLPPLISLPPSTLGSNHTVLFPVLQQSKFTRAAGTLDLLFPLPGTFFPSSLHGLPLLINQVLGKMSFLEKLSLTTLIFLPHNSPDNVFLFHFLLSTYYYLLTCLLHSSTRIKNYTRAFLSLSFTTVFQCPK